MGTIRSIREDLLESGSCSVPITSVPIPEEGRQHGLPQGRTVAVFKLTAMKQKMVSRLRDSGSWQESSYNLKRTSVRVAKKCLSMLPFHTKSFNILSKGELGGRRVNIGD